MIINLNKIFLNIIVCLISIQVTVLVGQIVDAFGPNLLLSQELLPESMSHLYPKHDLLLYGVFILTACLGSVLATMLLSKQLMIPHWWQKLTLYTVVEAVLTFLLISAVFKMTIYDNSPLLAKRCVYVLLALAVLIKLMWGELIRFIKYIEGNSTRFLTQAYAGGVADVFNVSLIITIIYLPDVERVVAQFFIGEQVHHFDFFLMSAGWAYLNGQHPYVGAISQYGVGVVALLSHLMTFFGGFDYVPALRMFVVLVIGYYICVYGFLRSWVGSRMLALAAFLIAFRLQMFHFGVNPLCWTYPSTTPLRFGLDILWLWCLLKHLRTKRMVFLQLAAIYSGFSLYYMTSTGACVAATFYFYLAAILVVPHFRVAYLRNKIHYTIAVVLPIVSALFFFWVTLGNDAFNQLFWHNMMEYMIFFAHGHAGGVLPIYESLKYRHYWASFMGFVLPLIYLLVLFVGGALTYLNRIKQEHFIAVIIAVYGLANYQYYVVRSAVTSYYMNALPFVLLSAFGVALFAARLNVLWRRRVLVASFILSAYALLTNHNYISYPNIFNFSKNPMVDITVAQRYPDRTGYFNHTVKPIKEADKVEFNALGDKREDLRTEDSFKNDEELKQYFRREFNFNDDAAMIQSLTKPGERVAVLSSFETKILIQSKRAPFFYHIPLITSYPMWLRFFPSDAAHSPNFLKETIGQLEHQKPRYVFMERIFLQDKIPASYEESNANILAIVRYIREHYDVVDMMKYLAAMKRKD